MIKTISLQLTEGGSALVFSVSCCMMFSYKHFTKASQDLRGGGARDVELLDTFMVTEEIRGCRQVGFA